LFCDLASEKFLTTRKSGECLEKNCPHPCFNIQKLCAALILNDTCVAAKDVGVLILASNNLRGLPAEVKKMKTLIRLDISRNGVRCTHPGVCNHFAKCTVFTKQE
jgi:hypothetical protein